MNEDCIAALEEERKFALEKMRALKVGSEEYLTAARAIATLDKMIVDHKSAMAEIELNKDKFDMEDRCNNDKLQQWEEEKEASDRAACVDKWCKIVGTAATLLTAVGSLAVYVLCFGASLNFEQTGTYTSMAGKENLRQIFNRIRR